MDSDIGSFSLSMGILLFFWVVLICFGGIVIIKKCGNPIPILTKDIDKKIWMTVWLGCVFTGLYLIAVAVFSRFIIPENYQHFFSFLYLHKVFSIYIGLGIFVFIALMICVVRAVIKRLFRRSKKY